MVYLIYTTCISNTPFSRDIIITININSLKKYINEDFKKNKYEYEMCEFPYKHFRQKRSSSMKG